MRLWIRNASYLLVIGTALRALGLLESDLYQLLSLLGFLIFVSTFLPGLTDVRGAGVVDAVVAGSIGALGVVVCRFAELGLLHLYVFVLVALLVLLRRSDSRDLRQLASYVVALACVVVVEELVRVVPFLWHLREGVAAVLSGIAEALARENRNLGPTAMALPLLAALMILWLVRQGLAEERHRGRWLFGLVLLSFTHLAYLVLLKYYARWLGTRSGADWFILNSQHAFLVLGSAVFTLADRGAAVRAVRLAWPAGRLRRVGVAAAAVLAAGIVAGVYLGWAPAPARRPATVMIYDAGYVNWEVPVHGKYGEKSAGMFGMLPAALKAAGFEVVVSDDLSRLDGPGAPDCFVMINIQKFLDDEDKARVWDFVSRGGGLLCLGDHTGVAGIRGPFNDLLEPLGIRFKFDSSTFFGKGWVDALEYRVHPVNRGVRSDEDYQIWVGASLDLDAKARPVVVGRYGYSDVGDPANLARAYLGDRRYNPDELLGDIVLVADARYGRGKVMVFGDTSGYQNLSFSRSLDTVAGSLYYLAGEGGWGRGTATLVAGLLWVVLAGVAGVGVAGSAVPVVALAVGLGIGSAVADMATPPPPSITPVFVDVRPGVVQPKELGKAWELAVLDVSHGGHHTLRAWRDHSVGGLQLNLARDGYFLVTRDRFPFQDLEGGAKLLLVLAPTRAYTSGEIAAVEDFVTNGGTVIVSVGFEELQGSRALLGRFGLDIADVPLGNVPIRVEGDTLDVDVREGWPVRYDESAPTEVLLSVWDYPVAVRRAVGRGEIVVIGDTYFFHDRNLETRDEYFAGNVSFLQRLIEFDRGARR
jgi:hypothetical protein